MSFAWKYLIPLSIAHVLLIAVEVSIVARLESVEWLIYILFVVFNVLITIYAVRSWAKAIGYTSEIEHPQQPVFATQMGGIKAARNVG